LDDNERQVWHTLRESVRADDSLMKIDPQTFLLLLLKSSNNTTRDIAARIQQQLASLGAKAVLEWAAVDLAPGAENQAFTSLADAIHHTAMEADGQTRRTTH
jgi:GGDEF domain-containing protein